jgi:hypothetical protein
MVRRSSSNCGMVMPGALVVFKLMIIRTNRRGSPRANE